MAENMIHIDPKIAAHIDAALAAGFTVYAQPGRDPRSVGHVYVCKEWDGPFALIQVPTHTFDPVVVDVPIEPHKDYGSAVLVDHDGTPAGAVAALEKACTEPMVTVRFMTRQYLQKHGTPRVPNYGNKTITKYGRTLDAMVKLGQRGTNWQVRQLAVRLEVGDRFVADLGDGRSYGILTVTDRTYNRDIVIVRTKELANPVEIPERTFVILAGAA